MTAKAKFLRALKKPLQLYRNSEYFHTIKRQLRVMIVPDLLNQLPHPNYLKHCEHQAPYDRYLPNGDPPQLLLLISLRSQQAIRQHPKITIH